KHKTEKREQGRQWCRSNSDKEARVVQQLVEHQRSKHDGKGLDLPSVLGRDGANGAGWRWWFAELNEEEERTTVLLG
ncbi:hypothetical protein S83_053410, partial [Arachis hypogaea]